MATFTKYEFSSPTEWATYKAKITDQDGNAIDCAIVEIGNICLATDQEGNCTDLSPLYAVDILWNDEPLESFSTKEVFPDPCGIHVFSGCEDMYLKRFCQFNHDSPFCNLET